MQKTISIILLLGALVIGFSNFTSSPKSTFIMTVVNEEPQLPDNPFNYSIEIPDHLLADPDTTIVIGYSSGPIQTSDVDNLDNDIVTLGRVLFYDEKLSAMENISCATCHDQSLSFTENKSFSEGISSETQRNSMHLNDLGWSNNEHFAWDMRRSNLTEMIRLPLTDENEIGANLWEIAVKIENTSYYPELFDKAFGDDFVVESRIVEAIKQFIASMHTFDSKFDQQAPNDFSGFTNQEMEGLTLFQENCSTCHSQGQHSVFGIPSLDALDDTPFIFNNGLAADEEDKGVGEWQTGMEGLFKVPTLRNIELTAPYMHDGRFNTLDEVIDHYSDDVIETQWTSEFIPVGGFQFADNEKAALKAFMQTLTDDTFINDEKWSNPFQEVSSSKETVFFQDLVLKPNPMSDRAVIEFKNENHKLVSLNIISSEGRLIKHDNTTSNQFVLEKPWFEPGMYYIELIMDDAKSSQKLIVQ